MRSVEELRKDIESPFPPIAYIGAVTPSEMDAWQEELDDSFELAEKLKGKAWTSIPAEFIDLHHGDLPLLTPGAFAAFVPAWINRALDDLDGENEVRDFTSMS